MLYVKLRKVLYSTLQAALLLWKSLSDTLIEWGFKLNEYDKMRSEQNNKWKAMHDHLACG